MNPYLQTQLLNLCEFPLSQKWELKYRATRDGYRGTDFHLKCDGIANTLTVIKTKNGNIFGGFTEKCWSSSNRSIADPKAFIFSLINKEKNPFKVKCSKNGAKAIGCYSGCGAIFGDDASGDEDIHITYIANIQHNSSNFGLRYKHPSYPVGLEKSKFILAGSYYFKTVDIEVFTKSS
jgi:hypothetical protein